jgi:uncharacterized protein YaiE (UPF0345 family)
VASIDTVTATSKITRTNKQDTSAFILLDTVTNLLWHYKTASNGWSQAGGSTFDTTSIKYVNTYGTQTVNGEKTFTSAVTASRFDPTSSSATGNGMFLPTTNTLGLSTAGVERMRVTSGFVQVRSGAEIRYMNDANNDWGLIKFATGGLNLGGVSIQNAGGVNSMYPITNNVTDLGRSSFTWKKAWFTNAYIDTLGINVTSPTEKLHVVGNARITGNVGIGVTTPTNAIDMVGQIRMTGATIASGLTKNINISGSQNFTDDEVKTISAGNVTFIMVADNNSGGGALFFASYASGTVVEIADPSNFGAVTDLDGFVCVYKNASSATINIKNRLGSTKSITVSQITVGD